MNTIKKCLNTIDDAVFSPEGLMMFGAFSFLFAMAGIVVGGEGFRWGYWLCVISLFCGFGGVGIGVLAEQNRPVKGVGRECFGGEDPTDRLGTALIVMTFAMVIGMGIISYATRTPQPESIECEITQFPKGWEK